MEAVERKVAEENAESEDEPETEEPQATDAMESQNGDNGDEGKTSWEFPTQEAKGVVVGSVSVILIVLIVNYFLEIHPELGMTVMIGAIGGLFGSIVDEFLLISESIRNLHPYLNE